MEAAEILKMPYARVVVPEEDGTFTAEILEFPGCVANGDSGASALAAVEQVALDWIEAEREQNHSIPEPLGTANYSGKLVVRMPQGLHRRAAQTAAREGASLNQLIVACIAEQVGMRARQPVMVYAQPQQTILLAIQGMSLPPSWMQFAPSEGGNLFGVPNRGMVNA